MEKERMKKMTSTMEKRVSTIHHGSSAPRNPLWTKSTNSSDLRQKIYFQFSLIVTYIYWYWTMVPRPIAPNSLFLLFKWLKSHFFGKKCTSKKKKIIFAHFRKNNFRSTFLMSQRFQIYKIMKRFVEVRWKKHIVFLLQLSDLWWLVSCIIFILIIDERCTWKERGENRREEE